MVDAATLAVICAIVCGCWLLLAAAIPLGRLHARRRAGRPGGETMEEWALLDATVPQALDEGDTRSLLQRGLRSDEREVRVAAVTALSGLAREHEWALDLLVEALASELETPERVATELDRLAPRPGNRLVPLLAHPSEIVRFYAVRLLARYDDLARRHAPRMTRDASANVRAAALEVLRVVPSGEAVRSALRSLDDHSPLVRAHAGRTVVAVAPVAARYVVPLLGDRSWWVREAAREALAAAGQEIFPAVEPAVRQPDAVLRSVAAIVLQDAGVIDALAEEDDPARLESILSAGGERLRAAATDRARMGIALAPSAQRAARARA